MVAYLMTTDKNSVTAAEKKYRGEIYRSAYHHPE